MPVYFLNYLMKRTSFWKGIAAALSVCFVALALVVIPQSGGAAGFGKSFNDVSLKHENVKAIDYLKENGVVIGYQDGTYQPERNISRAEFLKIVMEVSDFQPSGANCYDDVSNEWFAQYVCSATVNGLVEGYDDGFFRPHQEINFAEASKIVANTLSLSIGSPTGTWFQSYTEALEGKEAIPESIESFSNPLTRAQMAEMIWRIDANRTYKLAKTYNDIDAGRDLDSSFKNFNSCTELHDFLEDNASAPYFEVDTETEIPSESIRVARMMSEKGGCFTAGTQILMADGSTRSIEEVKAGDMILTRESHESDELVEARVLNPISHLVDGYMIVNGELELTDEHVVFVNGSWKPAGVMKVGDEMLDADGERIVVEKIEEVEDRVRVYNFEVENYHTYIANGYYVHNDKGGASQDYSSTNIQVAGVDESDSIKNDGKYIYQLDGETVKVIEAFPAENMNLVNTIEFDNENFWPQELYLDGDMLVVIGETYNGDYFNDFKSKKVDPAFYYHSGSVVVYVLDVSNPAKEDIIREVYLEGDYDDSRKIGDVLYTVTYQDNFVWPWQNNTTWTEDDLVPLAVDNGKLDKVASCEDIKYMPRQIDETNYMIISAIPLDKSSKIDTEVIVGSSSNVYSSLDNLYVVQEKYNWWGWYNELDEEEETYVHKFGLDGADIDYEGFGTVKGSVLNQFSMDEYKGNFRIATTVGDVWSDENPSVNNIYILDNNLNVTGSVEGLAPGERIYSARFIGDKGYIVTYKAVDPLFVFDLSNANNPKVLGELKIPGYSDYLHPYDENHLIGFGLDTQEVEGENFALNKGIKMAVFDVTDVNNPVQKHTEFIGDRGTFSDLNYDHKALLWSQTKGLNGGALMAFPIGVSEVPENDPEAFGEIVFQGAYVYDVNPKDGFNLRGRISHYDNGFPEFFYGYGNENVERIIYIGDYFYTVSKDAIKANEMTNGLKEVKRLDFPRPEVIIQ